MFSLWGFPISSAWCINKRKQMSGVREILDAVRSNKRLCDIEGYICKLSRVAKVNKGKYKDKYFKNQ